MSVKCFCDKGLLNAKQLEQARDSQTEGVRLDQAAVQLGFLSEETALRALANEVGLEFVNLVDADIDLSLLKDFPSRFVHREMLFPIRRNNGHLIVATSDPFNLYPARRVERGHGSDRRARASQPRRDRQADQEPSGGRQRYD